MASSIYNLLGFPTNDPILNGAKQELSADVKMQMNLTPSLVNSWQQEDIANNDATGYYKNPNQIGNNTTNTASQLVLSVCPIGNTVQGSTTTITNLLINTRVKANTLLYTTVPAFEYHTQRMSNVESMGEDTTSPHYELAVGYGKMLMFITNKSDGIEDNSPMIGSFGSIMASNVISANANTFLSFSQLYANTVTANTVDDGMGGSVTTYTSNISLSDAQSLSDVANNTYTLMNTYRTQDSTFFTNSKNVMDSYGSVSGFSRMGQTETDIIVNYIGTEKIKTRLNS